MNESDKAGEVKKQLSTLNLKHKENKQRKGKGNIQKCNVILKNHKRKKGFEMVIKCLQAYLLVVKWSQSVSVCERCSPLPKCSMKQ